MCLHINYYPMNAVTSGVMLLSLPSMTRNYYIVKIIPMRCNNCVLFFANAFNLHVKGDNPTHHQEYMCCIWPQVSRHAQLTNLFVVKQSYLCGLCGVVGSHCLVSCLEGTVICYQIMRQKKWGFNFYRDRKGLNPNANQSINQSRPGTHCIGDWLGPRAGPDGCRKSRPRRDSIPGPSSSQQVAIPTKLSRTTKKNKHDIKEII